jgi:ABC-type polysaccharide/polyol phosphate transport system ATPase subunit
MGRSSTTALRPDEFLALDDVSFAIEPGDSIALVGRNGAGKTTLLKMLNGMTKPDGGRITVRGNVQALINLGAGFNEALPGRDNIYNSASLVGLNRKQTSDLMAEIIDFAELDEFIDSPVQTYSSGMKARLGFAVAVHLKPDILLIDEILAVGDYAFRNKCFRKMQVLKKEGITIVLVTHDQNAILQMCDKAIWIHKGVAREYGPAEHAVKSYLAFLDELENQKLEKTSQAEAGQRAAAPHEADGKNEPKNAPAKDGRTAAKESIYGPIYDDLDHVDNLLVALRSNGSETSSLKLHDELKIGFRFDLKHEVLDLAVNFPIFREDALHMATISSMNGDLLQDIHAGGVDCEIAIPDFDLNPGTYVLVMCIHDGKSYLYRNIVKRFVVTRGDRFSWGVKDFRYLYEVKR